MVTVSGSGLRNHPQLLAEAASIRAILASSLTILNLLTLSSGFTHSIAAAATASNDTTLITGSTRPARCRTPSDCIDRQYQYPGWIVVGNKSGGSLPSCSYCVNAVDGNTIANYSKLSVGIYRCLKFDSNELWVLVPDNDTTMIQVSDRDQTLCLDAGRQEDYTGKNLNSSFLPMGLRQCDRSRPEQKWYLEGGRIRSGLKLPGTEEPLYMAQGELPAHFQGITSARFNLFLSTGSSIESSRAGNSSNVMTADFTFLRATLDSLLKLRSSDDPALATNTGELLANGGFEESTVLKTWPEGANCSLELTGPCSKAQFYDSEIFSLCGWAIVKHPERIPMSDLQNNWASWTAAEGNFSLLLSRAASINQTIPTEIGKRYVLSFSTARGLFYNPNLQALPSLISCEPPNSSDPIFLEVDVDGSRTNVELVGAREARGIWSSTEIEFTALADSAAIVFRSVSSANDTCGPLIDRVSVRESKTASRLRLPGFVIALVAGGLSTLIPVALCVCLITRRHRLRSALFDVGFEADLWGGDGVKQFALEELIVATKNFSVLVGEGSFGSVYLATLADGSMAAVKVEKRKAQQSGVFDKEVSLLHRIHHRNLVRLLGVCIEKGVHILVFEFLPNGNLCDRLHKSTTDDLPWSARVKIACDVACALEYLHHSSAPPIVHRDVKSSNILLTATDAAKLADFGLSKAAPDESSAFQSVATEVRGSFGYMDPQYVRSSIYSPKSDVYSYGVVLLELVSGHKAVKDYDILPVWAAQYLKDESRFPELVDPRLGDSYSHPELRTLLGVANLCLKEESSLRPSMKHVVTTLAALQGHDLRNSLT